MFDPKECDLPKDFVLIEGITSDDPLPPICSTPMGEEEANRRRAVNPARLHRERAREASWARSGRGRGRGGFMDVPPVRHDAFVASKDAETFGGDDDDGWRIAGESKDIEAQRLARKAEFEREHQREREIERRRLEEERLRQEAEESKKKILEMEAEKRETERLAAVAVERAAAEQRAAAERAAAERAAAEQRVAAQRLAAERPKIVVPMTQAAQPVEYQWLYLDMNKSIQGPFSSTEMRQWYGEGYLQHSLLLKRVQDREFVPLARLIGKDGSHPFSPGASMSVMNQLQKESQDLFTGSWPQQQQAAPAAQRSPQWSQQQAQPIQQVQQVRPAQQRVQPVQPVQPVQRAPVQPVQRAPVQPVQRVVPVQQRAPVQVQPVRQVARAPKPVVVEEKKPAAPWTPVQKAAAPLADIMAQEVKQKQKADEVKKSTPPVVAVAGPWGGQWSGGSAPIVAKVSPPVVTTAAKASPVPKQQPKPVVQVVTKAQQHAVNEQQGIWEDAPPALGVVATSSKSAAPSSEYSDWLRSEIGRLKPKEMDVDTLVGMFSEIEDDDVLKSTVLQILPHAQRFAEDMISRRSLDSTKESSKGKRRRRRPKKGGAKTSAE